MTSSTTTAIVPSRRRVQRVERIRVTLSTGAGVRSRDRRGGRREGVRPHPGRRRRQLARGFRRAGGPARAERLGQDHAAARDRRLRAARRGPRRRSRAVLSPATALGRARAPAHRDGLPGRRAVPAPDGGRQRRLRRRAARARGRVPGAGRPGRPRPATTRTSCRAASASASRSRARSPRTRRSCCSTSRSRRSTPGCATRCARRSTGILRAAGTSALLVTHDQAEALSLAGTVAVMRAGRIEQVGTPEEIYERPSSRWLAEFLGDADVLPGTAHDGVVDCELGRFGVPPELAGAVHVVIRPESVAIGLGAGLGRGGRRALVLRSRPARAARAAQRPAASQPAARLPGLAPGRSRADLGRRPGHGRRAGLTAR